MQLKNDRLIRALRREPVDMTPVWIMRQAGRYLPEYRMLREKVSGFMELCKTPELACEVTIQPLRRFALDAAIIFSDILTIPDAMGLGLEFIESKGPIIANPIRHPRDIARIPDIDLARLSYVYDTIRLTKNELSNSVPLIGFAGSPWTLAAYMIQGESKTGFPLMQAFLQEEPFALHQLLDILAEFVAAHLNEQISAGADVAMIFDTWGGMLDTQNYLEFSLYYLKRIISKLDLTRGDKTIPVILFTKGGHHWLEHMSQTGCHALGVDWEVTLKEARTRVGATVALQGNLHPQTLLDKPEAIRAEVQRTLDSFGHGSGHIFNLGHGITPEIPPEHVTVLVDAVHELSQPYHVK